MFQGLEQTGVVGRAIAKQQVQVQTWNPRDYTSDKHRTVDDRPYGGGPGMLLKPEPLSAAIADAKRGPKLAAEGINEVTLPGSTKLGRVVYFSPQGRRFNQALALEAARAEHWVFVCGRYEGIDERVINAAVDEEWSLGDFVLTGGELPALVAMDAISRLLPGVLGAEDSAAQDSFSDGLLDCPHYTRPELFAGVPVPKVLQSGDHEAIRRWRLRAALERTWLRRPDLLSAKALTDEEQNLLVEIEREQRMRDPIA